MWYYAVSVIFIAVLLFGVDSTNMTVGLLVWIVLEQGRQRDSMAELKKQLKKE
jgi:hypothetical protein